jgi:hypothetical protein
MTGCQFKLLDNTRIQAVVTPSCPTSPSTSETLSGIVNHPNPIEGVAVCPPQDKTRKRIQYLPTQVERHIMLPTALIQGHNTHYAQIEVLSHSNNDLLPKSYLQSYTVEAHAR